MSGEVEWNSASTGEIERAAVTSCREIDGVYHIEFARTALWQDSRLALPARPGAQQATAEYRIRDGAAHGHAGVRGELRRTPGGIEFIGTWHDYRDKDASTWYLLFEIDDVGGLPPATPNN